MLKRLLGKIGVDGAIAFSVLARGIQAIAGIASIFLVSLFLSKQSQGYFYTFGSIIAIQVFFELGMNSIITQYTAHEVVHLKWSSPVTLEGNAEYLSRLSSILHFCVRVFGILALVLFVLLFVVGHYFFSRYGGNVSTAEEWQWPWIIVSVATSLMLFINPVLAFLEGLGLVKNVAKIKVAQQVGNLVAVTIVLMFGGKLYALGIASLVSFCVICGSIFFSNKKTILVNIYRAKGEQKVNYWKEIFPYQYKIALSWISGYFIFQLFNPVLFATEGAVVAGQMGMTLQALNGLSVISMSWISTKIPVFCGLIAKKEYDTLDRSFNTVVKQIGGVSFVLNFGFLIFIAALSYFEYPLAGRFLPLLPLSLLCIVSFSNQFIFSWAVYLRCHKKEPFLINSVVIGLLCAASAIVLGREFGLMGIVVGYSILSVVIGMPWSYTIFHRMRLKWHSPDYIV